MKYIILVAQSHVGVSFEIPEYTTNTDALGTLRILEALRKVKKIKFYQAGKFRNVWKSFRNATNRENSVLSKKPLRCSESLFSLDNHKL